MPRYFVEPENITENEIVLVGEDVKHISTVLRSQIGEEIQVCDGCGNDYDCSIAEISKKDIRLEIIRKELSQSEPKTKVTLFQGLPKSDKMELIIQKCVEIGIETIVPVATDRAVVKLDKKDGQKKTERWQKISLSAAKQSGRGVIPKIESVMSFKEAIKLATNMEIAIIPYEKEEDFGIKEALKDFKGKELGVFIGPEGGFSDEEIQFAIENGVKPITLGKRILRTETAAIAVSAILLYELG